MLDFLHDPAFQSSLATVILSFASFIGLVIGLGLVNILYTKGVQGRLQYLKWVVSLAITAAEQYPGVMDKKQSAINVVNAYLKRAGITSFTADQIDAAIESAVFEELNKYRETVVVAPEDGDVTDDS